MRTSKGSNAISHKSLNLFELRLYTSYNLVALGTMSGTLTVTGTAESDSKLKLSNLHGNLAPRTGVAFWNAGKTEYAKPLSDNIGGEANFWTCYMTTNVQVGADGLWYITYDFTTEHFIHAILLVGSTFTENDDIPNHFPRNFEIYVGNNSDYKQNAKVPGGPRMNTDATRKVTSPRTGN